MYLICYVLLCPYVSVPNTPPERASVPGEDPDMNQTLLWSLKGLKLRSR